MKKFIIPFVALFVVAVSLISWRSTSSLKAGGGVSIYPEICAVFDGDGAIVTLDLSNSTVTPSGNGHIKCQASGLANSTGKAAKFNYENTGIECFIAGVGYTQDWQNTVSASGNSTLQCHAN